MAEKEVRTTKTKKTTGKATPRKVVSKSATKRMPSADTAKKTSTRTRKTTTRKAPTSLKRAQAQEKKTNAITWTGVGIVLLVLVGSVSLGFSDSGRINIATKTNTVKESATEEERKVIESIPVQQTTVPDGGLVPSGVPEEVAPVEPVAAASTTTASTSDVLVNQEENASSTIDRDADATNNTGSTASTTVE